MWHTQEGLFKGSNSSNPMQGSVDWSKIPPFYKDAQVGYPGIGITEDSKIRMDINEEPKDCA